MSHTCSYAINIFKKGPADYKKIIGSGVLYTDPDFPPGQSSIYWTDFPRPVSTGSSLASVASTLTWSRAITKFQQAYLYGLSTGE